MEWRNLATIRELCRKTRNLFQSRLAPIRALQHFTQNAGFDFLRRKELPALCRSSLELYELNRSYLRTLKEDYFDEGRHMVSSSDNDSDSFHFNTS